MIPDPKISNRSVAARVLWTVGCLALASCQGSETESQKYVGDMVLALSWQPGFCETRPRLRECKSQTAQRFDASHFSLHGLWPQPRNKAYCGVPEAEVQRDKSSRWKSLAVLGLSDTIKKQLWTIMPGSRSFLHRHEWVKHGTCYSQTPETYYADSIVLVDAINASPIQKLFEDNIGRKLTNRQISTAFDNAFGQGVGARVRVACKRDGKRTVITEITIGLSGQITGQPDITRLALASPKTKAGCPVGIVDAAGFQ